MRSTSLASTGCSRCPPGPSYSQMHSIAFSPGFVLVSNTTMDIAHIFDSQSVRVKESNVFSRKYCTEVTNLSTLSVFEVEVWCYRGGDTVPKWIHRSSDAFSTLCYVRADLSPLAGSAQAKQGRNQKMYWTIVFSIEIHFGLTEFKARIKWVDNVGGLVSNLMPITH